MIWGHNSEEFPESKINERQWCVNWCPENPQNHDENRLFR